MNYLKKELYDSIKSNSIIFEFIQNNSLDGLWYWDLENMENRWMNERFWEVLGYDPDKIPHKTSAWQNIINKEDLALANDNAKKHLENPDHPYDQIVRYTCKNGSTVWIRCKGLAIRNKEGIPVRMLGSHQDVTELKKNEAVLKHCNEEASIGFWDMDLSNKTISWSDVAKKIHGVSNEFEPSLETGINFYKEGYNQEKITDLVFYALNHGEGFNEELQIVTPQGQTKWVKVLGIPEKNHNNTINRIYGTIQDIDVLKKNQLKLEESERAFRGNFENAAIGMALLDKDGKWLKVNQTLCNIIGYTTNEFYKLTFQDISHPEDLDLDLSLLREVLDGKRDHYKMDKRYFHKKGHIVYIHLAVSVVRDEKDEVLYFISQIVDMTKQKKQEKKLKRIIDLTQDHNERLKNFAHIVSHNLRSHSGGISSLLSFLKEDKPEYFENEIIKLLETSSNNLLETIEHLTEVVQINLSSKDNFSLLPLKPIVDKQITSIRPLAEKNKVNIINNIDLDTKVLAIQAYLESITLNFISNAVKYSSHDRESFLQINSIKNGAYTIIEFKDNGLGINLDLHSKKLFGMYKTFHNNKDSRGIGLFITKSQIETLGGKVEVSSEVNKGTTFKVYLKNEKS